MTYFADFKIKSCSVCLDGSIVPVATKKREQVTFLSAVGLGEKAEFPVNKPKKPRAKHSSYDIVRSKPPQSHVSRNISRFYRRSIYLANNFLLHKKRNIVNPGQVSFKLQQHFLDNLRTWVKQRIVENKCYVVLEPLPTSLVNDTIVLPMPTIKPCSVTCIPLFRCRSFPATTRRATECAISLSCYRPPPSVGASIQCCVVALPMLPLHILLHTPSSASFMRGTTLRVHKLSQDRGR